MWATVKEFFSCWKSWQMKNLEKSEKNSRKKGNKIWFKNGERNQKKTMFYPKTLLSYSIKKNKKNIHSMCTTPWVHVYRYFI